MSSSEIRAIDAACESGTVLNLAQKGMNDFYLKYLLTKKGIESIT